MKLLLCLLVLASVPVFAQSDSAPAGKKADAQSNVSTAEKKTSSSAQAAASTVPVLDGGIGPCSAEFQVTTGDSKPLYNAQVHTLIKYGAFGVRKLDLAGSTNVDGKIKFTGLPDVNKRPVFFDITLGEKTAQRTFEPGVNCHPVFAVILQ